MYVSLEMKTFIKMTHFTRHTKVKIAIDFLKKIFIFNLKMQIDIIMIHDFNRVQ